MRDSDRVKATDSWVPVSLEPILPFGISGKSLPPLVVPIEASSVLTAVSRRIEVPVDYNRCEWRERNPADLGITRISEFVPTSALLPRHQGQALVYMRIVHLATFPDRRLTHKEVRDALAMSGLRYPSRPEALSGLRHPCFLDALGLDGDRRSCREAGVTIMVPIARIQINGARFNWYAPNDNRDGVASIIVTSGHMRISAGFDDDEVLLPKMLVVEGRDDQDTDDNRPNLS